MIGLGAQDDFNRAEAFVDGSPLEEVTMLWDPSFSTWQHFGVTINSQMMIIDGGLEGTTNLFYGFGTEEQDQILEALSDFG